MLMQRVQNNHTPVQPEIVNQHEIVVAAMMRSGYHAIVNWIASQCPGKVCFLNWVRPGTNPFQTATQNLRAEGLDNYDPRQFNFQAEATGNLTPKDWLIYSYEEEPLSRVASPIHTMHHDDWVGPSRSVKNVLVLRDPYNQLASRLHLIRTKGEVHHDMPSNLRACLELWKEYAREYLGETNRLGPGKVCINYNRWFTSEPYRKAVSEALGLSFNDLSLNTVRWEYGGGSSFDESRFQGRAQRMRVLERWKLFTSDPDYLELVDDPELAQLARRCFGNLAPVDRFTAEG